MTWADGKRYEGDWRHGKCTGRCARARGGGVERGKVCKERVEGERDGTCTGRFERDWCPCTGHVQRTVRERETERGERREREREGGGRQREGGREGEYEGVGVVATFGVGLREPPWVSRAWPRGGLGLVGLGPGVGLVGAGLRGPWPRRPTWPRGSWPRRPVGLGLVASSPRVAVWPRGPVGLGLVAIALGG